MPNTKAARFVRRRQSSKVAGLRTLGKNRKFLFAKLFRDIDRITVGRVRRHKIYLDDETVSVDHCEIERSSDGEYKMIDLGSTNGIYVAEFGAYSREVKVSEFVLKMGMHIRLGDMVLTPVDKRAEAPVIVKQASELFRRLKELYGSYRETANHLKPSRETLRRRAQKRREAEKAEAKRKRKGRKS